MSANGKPLSSEDAIVACLNILAALTASSTGTVDTATIEREFDLTDQQLEEAVDLLQSLADERTGARVAVELEGGRITLFGTAGRISPLRLTSAESLALGQALARCNLDPEVRKRIQDALGPAGKADDPRLLAGDALLGGFFPVIAEALSIGARLRMRYRSVLESSPSERIVDPGYIEVVGDSAYLVAWDVSKNLQRSYRLDRIGGCELTDDSVVVHRFTRFSAADSLREHGQSAVLIWENEQLFHSCTWAGIDRESARALDDGRVEATVSYASEPWLFDQVLAAGGRILIAAPADLVSPLTAYAHS